MPGYLPLPFHLDLGSLAFPRGLPNRTLPVGSDLPFIDEPTDSITACPSSKNERVTKIAHAEKCSHSMRPQCWWWPAEESNHLLLEPLEQLSASLPIGKQKEDLKTKLPLFPTTLYHPRSLSRCLFSTAAPELQRQTGLTPPSPCPSFCPWIQDGRDRSKLPTGRCEQSRRQCGHPNGTEGVPTSRLQATEQIGYVREHAHRHSRQRSPPSSSPRNLNPIRAGPYTNLRASSGA